VRRMVAQRRGWPHRVGGDGCDGGDAPRWPYITTSSWASAESVAVALSRVSSSSFEGLDVEEVQEWVAQCYGVTLTFPHSTRTTPWMAAQCGFGRTVPGYDSQVVSEGRSGGDSPLTRAPVTCQSIQCPGRGASMVSRVEGDLEGLGPSSEVRTRPRGHQALE
jgi:hypothetical protein